MCRFILFSASNSSFLPMLTLGCNRLLKCLSPYYPHGDPDDFNLDPTLVLLGIWGVNKLIEVLPISVFSLFCAFKIKKVILKIICTFCSYMYSILFVVFTNTKLCVSSLNMTCQIMFLLIVYCVISCHFKINNEK